MNDFTMLEFSNAMEQKQFNGPVKFFSSSFEFTDEIESGLKRVKQSFDEQGGLNRFSMEFKPVWEGQGKPYVTAFIVSRYITGMFGMDSWGLNYWNGFNFHPVFSTSLNGPMLSQIPPKSEISLKLSNLTDGIQPKNKKKRRLKL